MEDKIENGGDDQPDVLEKPKKPRTEKQIAATKRMLEARENKGRMQLDERAKREEKQREEEENLKQLVTEKIVKKAINIKKKRHSKQEIIEKILNSESSSEEEDVTQRLEKQPCHKKITPPPLDPKKILFF